MSNFIFNDGLNDKNNEPIKVSFSPSPVKKQSNKPLFICTAILVFVGLIFSGSVVFASLNKQAPVSDIKVTVAEVSTTSENKSAASPLSSTSESRVDVIAKIKDSVVEISTADGSSGSGVIVGEFEDTDNNRGYFVITNAHVIQSSSNITTPSYVTLTDGTKYSTTVSGVDSKSDIAVLKIYENTKNLTVATWANASSKLAVGEDVIVIGNPLGVLGGSVTNGYLSALDREISVDGIKMNLLQTDAAVNPGNSGGGLFNIRGELIGIVNAKISKEEVEGIGFAIPYTDAYNAFLDLSTYGYVKGRPTIGASFITSHRGIEVYEANIKSVLSQGDIVKELMTSDSDKFVPVTANSFEEFLNNLEIGDTFKLRVVRRGATITLNVTVYEYTK